MLLQMAPRNISQLTYLRCINLELLSYLTV
jgi:hypothetical protein